MLLLLNYVSIFMLSSVILLSITFWYYKKFIFPYNALPGYSIIRVVKNILFYKIPKDMTRTSYYFQNLRDMCEVFQPEGLCLMWFLHPYVFIFSEEAIKLFLKEKAALNKSHNYDVLKEGFGNGLSTSNGDFWKKQRKILSPAFNVSMLKDKAPVTNKQANILVKELMKVSNDPVNIHKHLELFTFSNICEFLLGIDPQERRAEAEYFIKLVVDSGQEVIQRFFFPWLRYPLYFTANGRKYHKDLQGIRNFATKILLEVKQSALQHENNIQAVESDEFCRVPGRSFARILVENHLKDTSFTFEQMVDELTTFVIAGFDSVSYALMWTIFLLGHHMEVQDQVYNELESVAESDLSFDDLHKLTYMECVIKESLRLYPTIPIYARHLEKDVKCGKYNIPKDAVIVFFPFVYHRNPELYPDPEKFDPERFSGGSSANRPWTHIPFSEGMRNCIGKNFALMETKIALAHILRHFKITSLDRREDIKLDWYVILRTVKPLYVRLSSRRDESLTQG